MANTPFIGDPTTGIQYTPPKTNTTAVAKSPTAEELLARMKAGSLYASNTPGDERAKEWQGMYQPDQNGNVGPTDAQFTAFSMWQDYNKQLAQRPETPKLTPGQSPADFINGGQAKMAAAGEVPMTRNNAGDVTIDKYNAMATMEAPKAPKLVDTFNAQRTSLGIDDLEKQQNELKAQEEMYVSKLRNQTSMEQNARLPMSVIAGRQNEETRQANEMITENKRQQQYIVNDLNTKYGVIKSIMDLTQQDYVNAKNTFDTDYKMALDAVNMAMNINTQQQTQQEKERANAMASYMVMFNGIANGSVDPSKLTPTQKTTLSKLELQAGLPLGTYQTVMNTNPASNIVSKSEWTDVNGNKYASIVTLNKATGKYVTQNVLLGKEMVNTPKVTNTRTANGQEYMDIVNTQTGTKTTVDLGPSQTGTGTGTSKDMEQQDKFEKSIVDALKNLKTGDWNWAVAWNHVLSSTEQPLKPEAYPVLDYLLGKDIFGKAGGSERYKANQALLDQTIATIKNQEDVRAAMDEFYKKSAQIMNPSV